MKESMVNDYGMPSLVQLIFSLFFVIALIYFTGWFYQKLNLLNKKQLSKLDSSSDLYRFSILQSVSLGQQRQLYTLKMNDKMLLIGSTPNNINLLKEFDVESAENIQVSAASNEQSPKNNTLDIDELYKKYKN
jgi:flagellar biosynthetic protein FliO